MYSLMGLKSREVREIESLSVYHVGLTDLVFHHFIIGERKGVKWVVDNSGSGVAVGYGGLFRTGEEQKRGNWEGKSALS